MTAPVVLGLEMALVPVRAPEPVMEMVLVPESAVPGLGLGLELGLAPGLRSRP